MIRSTREYSGESLRSAARRIGVSATFQSAVERGLGSPPSDAYLYRAARVLGIDVDGLFAAEGRIAPDLIEWIAARPAIVDELRKRQDDRGWG